MSTIPAVNASTPAALERVQQIIDAATAVMSRQGYSNTSMKDIALEAGIAQGLIHYYFASKEDLLLAVVQTMCDEMLAESEAAFAAGDRAPLQRALAGLQAARERCMARPETVQLLFEMVALSATNPSLRQQMSSLYKEINESVTAMVEELNRDLPTQMPVPAADFAAVIIAAIDGLAVRALIDPAESTERLYRALAFLLISAGAASYASAGQDMPPVQDILDTMMPVAAAGA